MPEIPVTASAESPASAVRTYDEQTGMTHRGRTALTWTLIGVLVVVILAILAWAF